MSKVLITPTFAPFTASWGVVCEPTPCIYNGSPAYFVPDGWQEELTEHGVTYTEVDSEEITFPEPEE
jgi:hypothetical protein